MTNQELLSNLEFEFSLKPSNMEVLCNLVLNFEGKAVLWDDELGDDITIAKIDGVRVDISLARKSFDDLHDLFDTISPEISDLGTHILSNNNCYVEAFSNTETEETICSALVYIQELIVERDYRNNGIGQEMLRRMSGVMDMNDTLVALKAVPIVDEKTETRTEELKRKLKKFYTQLGFNHSGEHYMVKDARDCHAQRMRSMTENHIKYPG